MAASITFDAFECKVRQVRVSLPLEPGTCVFVLYCFLVSGRHQIEPAVENLLEAIEPCVVHLHLLVFFLRISTHHLQTEFDTVFCNKVYVHGTDEITINIFAV